jgi:uncharacterized membrane protein YkgB
MSSAHITATASRSLDTPSADRLIQLLETIGIGVLRYGLVLLVLMWGAMKFGAFEAEAIKPLVENSPLTGWMYGVFGLRGAAALFGMFEVTAAILIATRRWFPRVSGYASLAASSMFLVTLSFLITTPHVLEPTSPWGGFLMKDIILLGAALFTSAEALRAARGSVA